MIHLLLSTLAMMGLTFLIGFFVAAVIKLIAYAADSFDFYSSHKLELIRLHRWRQHRQKVEKLVRQIPLEAEEALGDYREDFSLLDYYYPRDTREFFLKEEERAHINKKNSKKPTANKQ